MTKTCKKLNLISMSHKFENNVTNQMKKEEIWLSPMTKAPTPTEKSKKQRDNTKNANKNLDYTTIADRLTTVSWGNDSYPIGVVKPVFNRHILYQLKYIFIMNTHAIYESTIYSGLEKQWLRSFKSKVKLQGKGFLVKKYCKMWDIMVLVKVFFYNLVMIKQ